MIVVGGGFGVLFCCGFIFIVVYFLRRAGPDVDYVNDGAFERFKDEDDSF